MFSFLSAKLKPTNPRPLIPRRRLWNPVMLDPDEFDVNGEPMLSPRTRKILGGALATRLPAPEVPSLEIKLALDRLRHQDEQPEAETPRSEVPSRP